MRQCKKITNVRYVNVKVNLACIGARKSHPFEHPLEGFVKIIIFLENIIHGEAPPEHQVSYNEK